MLSITYCAEAALDAVLVLLGFLALCLLDIDRQHIAVHIQPALVHHSKQDTSTS
jgi:hypothetical protein